MQSSMRWLATRYWLRRSAAIVALSLLGGLEQTATAQDQNDVDSTSSTAPATDPGSRAASHRQRLATDFARLASTLPEGVRLTHLSQQADMWTLRLQARDRSATDRYVASLRALATTVDIVSMSGTDAVLHVGSVSGSLKRIRPLPFEAANETSFEVGLQQQLLEAGMLSCELFKRLPPRSVEPYVVRSVQVQCSSSFAAVWEVLRALGFEDHLLDIQALQIDATDNGVRLQATVDGWHLVPPLSSPGPWAAAVSARLAGRTVSQQNTIANRPSRDAFHYPKPTLDTAACQMARSAEGRTATVGDGLNLPWSHMRFQGVVRTFGKPRVMVTISGGPSLVVAGEGSPIGPGHAVIERIDDDSLTILEPTIDPDGQCTVTRRRIPVGRQ